MPEYVVDKVTEALNDRSKSVRGSKIAILGVAYKKDVDDPRESPAFCLMELLAEKGAILSYSDPQIPVLPAMRSFDVPSLNSECLTEEYLREQDCVLIATDHSAFDYESIVKFSSCLVDTRNATGSVQADRSNVVHA